MEINPRIQIFLLTSIGLITLPHINHLPAPTFTFFTLMLSWRFACIWKPAWLPNNKLIFLFMIAGITLLYSQQQGVFGRDAGTGLFVTALGLKLLETRSSRDIYLTNYLAFIVASTQFLYQQSILMAVYILFVCCVLLATLVAINSQRPKTTTALKTAVLIIVQAFPLAIVLFVLFPRLQAPRWMLFEDQHQARTGLSDTLEPGAISRLGLSDELAFRVKFDGDIPPPSQRYWRGPVFSRTDGKRWMESKNKSSISNATDIRYLGKAYHYTLMMEPQNKRWVYALDMPAEFSTPLHRNRLYQLITRADPEERAEYRITSYPRYNTGSLSKTELQNNLQLPNKPVPRITELVKQLNGFDAEPEIFIERLLNYFRREDFHYTLMPEVMEKNPIETFLFKTRRGFCSHYATAFVYLMRVAKIPARVVGGYQGGQINDIGGFLEIRQANAHAWAEVGLEGKGWVRVDPTAAIAPERVEQDVNIDFQIASGRVNFIPVDVSASMSWLKRGRQLWNSIDYSWHRWVINYHSANQNRFLSSLGLDNLKKIAYGLAACIAVVSGLLAWLVLRKQRVKSDAVMTLYRKFCHKLAQKTGLKIETGEGARHFAQRVVNHYPELTEPMEAITALFIKLRYEADSSEEDLRQLKQLIKNFKITVA